MPQPKSAWLGGATQEPLERAIRDAVTYGGGRDRGAIELEGVIGIPLQALTDNRLAPASIRVYGFMIALAHPGEAGPSFGVPVGAYAFVGVADRILEVALGVSRDVIRGARRSLEEHGYIRRLVGSTKNGDWNKGYQGHWHGKNRPPVYELVGVKPTGYGNSTTT